MLQAYKMTKTSRRILGYLNVTSTSSIWHVTVGNDYYGNA